MAKSLTIKKKKVTLEFKAEPQCEVFLAGTFNDWNPGAKKMKHVDGDGRYEATLLLPPGRYEYKFVVNGDWHIDTNNPAWTPNGVGSKNSVIEVS
jgi:1,4-alpha-glucan branching enzyme